MITEIKKTKEEKNKEKKFTDVTVYQSARGSLIYLTVATRPDIVYAVIKQHKP